MGVMGRMGRTVERTTEQVLARGGRALPIVGDVSLEAGPDPAVRQVAEHFGRLDIVVADAAIQLHKRDRTIHEHDLDAWKETQRVNLCGAFLTCRAGVRQMLAQGDGGAIVIVSSVTAHVSSAPQNPADTASKGGLVSFGRALAIQYAPQGIRCNVVCPGALEQPPDAEEVDLAAREKRLVARIPLGRSGRFEEITRWRRSSFPYSRSKWAISPRLEWW